MKVEERTESDYLPVGVWVDLGEGSKGRDNDSDRDVEDVRGERQKKLR